MKGSTKIVMLAAMSVFFTTAEANFNFIKSEKATVVAMNCKLPDRYKVVECVATYNNTTTQKWWLQERGGVVYRFGEYPTKESKPVPFSLK